MGYEVFDREVEEDRPPAGTPCCVCKTMGHWCQAEVWTAGDSGNGICKACVEGRDCSVVAVKRKKEVPLEAEPLGVPVAPVKRVEVPLAAVKVERGGVIELPAAMEWDIVGPVIRDVFEIPAVTKDEKAANRRQMIADMLIEGKTVNQISHELNFSERVILDVKAGIPSGKLPKRGRPAGATYKNEQRNQAAELLKNGSSTRDTAAAVGLARGTVQEVRHEIGVTEKANNGGGDFQKQRFGGTIGRLLQLKAGETIALGAIEGLTLEEFAEDLKYELKHYPKTSDKRWLTKVSDGRIIAGWMPGNELRLSTERAPKSPQRPIIKNLIGSGVSVRSAAEIAGVSTNTVQTVKREMREEGIPLFVSSNSPVSQGKRSTYIIPAEVRKQISEESVEIDNQVLATKYGCSRATIDNIRKAVGVTVNKETKWGAIIERCLALKEGEKYIQPVLWDLERSRFMNQMRGALSNHRKGCQIEFSVQGIWEPGEDGPEILEDKVQVGRGRDRRVRRAEEELASDLAKTSQETLVETATETTSTSTVLPPTIDLTLSHAFEMVIAEYNKGIAVMTEDFADDDSMMKSVEKMKAVVNDLQESHPAVSQLSWTGAAFSVYDLARKQAEGELAVLKSESQRINDRKKALEEILAVLKKHENTEQDTR